MPDTDIVKTVDMQMVVGDGLILNDFDAAKKFGEAIIKQKMNPAGMDTPEQIAICVLTGYEYGWKTMQSLRTICVVKGKAGIYTKAALGLVRSRNVMKQWMKPQYTGKPYTDEWTCIVASERYNPAGLRDTPFSLARARKAGLYPATKRDGSPDQYSPWTKWTDRMLYARALGIHLDTYYSDVTLGLPLEQELHDTVYAPDTRRIEGPPATDKFLEEQPETKPPKQLEHKPPTEMTDKDFDEMASQVPVGPDQGESSGALFGESE